MKCVTAAVVGVLSTSVFTKSSQLSVYSGGAMAVSKTFSLPFDIEVSVDDRKVNIESELARALPTYDSMVETGRIVGVIEGIEQLLMSLARAGVDLDRPEFAGALRDCVGNLQQ